MIFKKQDTAFSLIFRLKPRMALLSLFLFATVYCLLPAAVYAEPPKRIISLAPSITEILYTLGLEKNIVGVTSYCDYPEGAKKKPRIGGMSNPSLEAVVALKPDLVVVSTDGNPREFEERLRLMKIRTYVFKGRQFSQFPNELRKLGTALGAKEKSDVLAKETEDMISNMSKKPMNAGAGSSGKKILFIVWPEPLIVAGPGTAIDDAIKLLGHENIASKAKSTYPKYSIEEVIRQSPDVIFIGRQMGKDISAVSQGFLQKTANVPAVKNKKVFYVGDSLYRMGPRAAKGIEELAECLK